MKKIPFLLGTVLIVNHCFGQTNIFPATGKVGIGTISPISVLDIATNKPSLYLRNTGAATSVIRLIPYTDGKTYFETGSSTDPDSRADLNFASMTGTTNFMTIQGSTGNVGIGTSSPTNLLTLYTGNSRNGIKLISGLSSPGGLADIQLTKNTTAGITTGSVSLWNISLRNDGYFSASPPTGLSLEFYGIRQGGGYYAPLVFTSNGNVILVSNKGAVLGNVLIGKTSQTNTSYRLDVNGNIRANKVVVNTTGADYVLDSAYQLLSLDSLDKFIKKYRHLPGVTTAAQMKEQGVDIGKNQTVLLKKMEEMTLYIISLQKQIAGLQDQIKSLSQKKVKN